MTTKERLEQIKDEIQSCRERIRRAHEIEDAAKEAMQALVEEQGDLIAKLSAERRKEMTSNGDCD